MRLKEIMTTPVETIEPTDLATEARARMKSLRVHHLVVTHGRLLMGIVSQRDTAGAGTTETVADIMADAVVTAEPDTTLKRAANLMRGRSIGCLPVLEKGKLVGIVTASDLLELLGRGAEQPNPRGTRRTLTGSRGTHRKARPGPDGTRLAY